MKDACREMGFKFLSTLPARGATWASILQLCPARYFYPRSPRGERPDALFVGDPAQYFYPRSPRGERLLS